MNVYYNEHDPFAAAWLRELIRDGLIPAGDVDERDIQLVQPTDLAGYRQCHFFAGIGGWAYALELAGYGDRPVWTGSCPCQPFSVAGKGSGFAGARHLWPTWFRLIRECRPPIVFGEQVASADGLGWFDTVSTDLEAEAYAVGAADLPAASVGAPHLRQRLFFVGNAASAGLQTERVKDKQQGSDADTASGVGLADTDRAGQRSSGGGVRDERDDLGRGSPVDWADLVWLPCTDGKARPTQSGLLPLVDGVRNRVGTLRGAGNAIVPQVGAAFVRAFLAAEAEMSR